MQPTNEWRDVMHKGKFLFFIFSIFIISCQNDTYGSPDYIKQAIKSVVKVSVDYVVEDKITLSSLRKSYVASGFSIYTDSNTNKSYILTNKHVCEMRSAAHYALTLSTGEVLSALYVRSDSFADICLIETTGSILPLALSRKNATQGERIVTIGAPDGIFPIIVDGTICGYYDIEMHNGINDDAMSNVNFRAQTISAPIYHGSSGSPVLNMHGNVAGIVFAVRNEKEHISFMVPISEVIRFLDITEYVHIG